jgi:hypothetical protein
MSHFGSPHLPRAGDRAPDADNGYKSVPLGTASTMGPMGDWIFEDSPRDRDLDARVAAGLNWWGTPRYRDRIAVGDRVWLQVTGRKDPGIYYVATVVSKTYEHPAQPADPDHFRWRTDIRFDFRVRPPLLRSELLEDVEVGSFRPFRGFQGSNVPVPSDVAAALMARAAPRLEPLPGENE